MNTTIKYIKDDANVDFCHAPSLMAAIRKSAEDVVLSAIKGDCQETSNALCAYILGNVDCDVTRISADYKYMVDFYSDNSSTPFAMAIVDFA
jgi:hypothetical protein